MTDVPKKPCGLKQNFENFVARYVFQVNNCQRISTLIALLIATPSLKVKIKERLGFSLVCHAHIYIGSAVSKLFPIIEQVYC